MWRSKKFIVAAVLATVILAGSIGGVVMAADGDEESGPAAKLDGFISQVVGIYNADPDRPADIDADILKSAVTEAKSQMKAEALENRLAKMVEDGVIDEGQAAELRDWVNSKPDVPFGFGSRGRCGFRGKGDCGIPPAPAD